MKQENAPIRRLDHLVSETNAIYHVMSLSLGLSDSISMILYTLACEGQGIRISDLCRTTGLTRQTVHSALQKLQREGIIRLEAADGKSKVVFLTLEGEAYTERTAARILEAENSVFASWPEEDIQTYLRLAQRFRDDLKDIWKKETDSKKF